MAKGKIVNHLVAGQYSVLVHRDISKTTERLNKLNDSITKNDAKITSTKSDIVTAQSASDTIKTALNTLIDNYKSCADLHPTTASEDCKTELELMNKKNIEYINSLNEISSLNDVLDGLLITKDRFAKEKAIYNDLPSEWTLENIWCVDLCDGEENNGDIIPADTIVGLISIYSFTKKKYEHFIAPSSFGRDNSWNSSYGDLQDMLGLSPEGYIFNKEHIGTGLAWNAQYRIATITSIDHDAGTANVSYWALTDDEYVGYGGNEPTTNIPFDYMFFGFNSFHSSDSVIISFCKTQLASPVIIGFYSNPKHPELDVELVKQNDVYTNNKYWQYSYRTNNSYESTSNLVRDTVSPRLEIASKIYIVDINYVTIYSSMTSGGYEDPYLTDIDNTGDIEIPTNYNRIFFNGVYKRALVSSYSAGIYGGFYMYLDGDSYKLRYYKLTIASGLITVIKYILDLATNGITNIGTDSISNSNFNALVSSYSNKGLLNGYEYVNSVASESNLVTSNTGEQTLFIVQTGNDYRYSANITAFTLKITGDNTDVPVLSIIATYYGNEDDEDVEIKVPQCISFDYSTNEINTLTKVYTKRSSIHDPDLVTEIRFLFNNVYIDNSISEYRADANTFVINGPFICVSLAIGVFSFFTYSLDVSSGYETTTNYGINIKTEAISFINDIDDIVDFNYKTIGGLSYCRSNGFLAKVREDYSTSVILNQSGDTVDSNLNNNFNIFNYATNQIPPAKIINIKITSNNTDTTKAKEGDTITLTFDQTQELGKVLVNIAGSKSLPSKSGDNYTATYTVTGSTPEIETQFSIIADGEEFTRTSGAGRCTKVDVDTTKPIATITDNYLKADTAFYFTLTFSEDIDGLSHTDVIISNGTMIQFKQGEINPRQYKIKVKPTSTTVNLGINAGLVSDLAGNTNATVSYNAVL